MRFLASVPLLGVLTLALACPDPAIECGPRPPGDAGEEITDDDVVYGGLGNDEVWLTLYDAKGRAQAGGDAAVPVVPTEGQALPADALPTFEWESALRLTLGPSAPEPLFAPRRPSAVDRLSRFLIPSAWAHLPPVTSDAYLLEVAIPGRTCPRSVVTTGLLHTLDEATWAELKTATGQDLTLTIWSAYLTTGVITEGPFVSEPVHFRVE